MLGGGVLGARDVQGGRTNRGLPWEGRLTLLDVHHVSTGHQFHADFVARAVGGASSEGGDGALISFHVHLEARLGPVFFHSGHILQTRAVRKEMDRRRNGVCFPAEGEIYRGTAR